MEPAGSSGLNAPRDADHNDEQSNTHYVTDHRFARRQRQQGARHCDERAEDYVLGRRQQQSHSVRSVVLLQALPVRALRGGALPISVVRQPVLMRQQSVPRSRLLWHAGLHLTTRFAFLDRALQ